MRSCISRRALIAAAFGTASLILAGSALGAGGHASTRAKIFIKGGASFKPNAYIRDTVHFDAGTVVIRSGGTVTLTNTSSDPHSLSIVAASQLPRSLQQIENCTVCGVIAKTHGVNPEGPPPTGPPPIPLVNVAAAGFDKPGDSIVIGPKGHGSRVTFKVTARPGTTLHFMCIIHPWMQGRFLVR
jgi:plastocyanin